MTDDTPSPSPAASARRQALRERFDRAQTIAAQAARARSAGGAPSDDEAARLVAEFHAQGGRVTVCPPAEEETPAPSGKR
ncbi:hypothetical protein [Roseicella sp. DB1501]|jgi:hypothetical protein|uniref:hypothetical protein n=1 Tax=Roseicella sp. DB1501 TaxID=2730925 RepID=UPI001490C9A3|nr:hypothetical protein [Roseicella sp. DB1501]NOG73836.1 hypothetical protein [Roseicella sp. DB1501]